MCLCGEWLIINMFVCVFVFLLLFLSRFTFFGMKTEVYFGQRLNQTLMIIIFELYTRHACKQLNLFILKKVRGFCSSCLDFLPLLNSGVLGQVRYMLPTIQGSRL